MSIVEAPSKVWTVEEVHALVDLGFPGAEKLELIGGELIDRMRRKRLHVVFQTRIMNWLQAAFGPERVQSEAPVYVAADDSKYNEPEPDLMVTAKAVEEYTDAPLPEDVLLLVEISDSSVAFDLTVKAALYARAGIVEYWVVDVTEKRIVVHRGPLNGAYSSIVSFTKEAEIAPIAAPGCVFCLERLFRIS